MTISISCWQSPPQALQLTTGQIDLWRYRLDAAPSKISVLKNLLSADESARAEKLQIPVKRQQFIVARAGLRKILGKYLHQSPQDLLFVYLDEGKPVLAESQGALDFNLSHSGSWVLLAVTCSGDIGVDIEQIDEGVSIQQIADNYYNRKELACLENVAGQRKRRVFYRLWTRKESCLKMHGTGLAGASRQLITTSARSIYIAPQVVAALSASFETTSINKFQLTEL